MKWKKIQCSHLTFWAAAPKGRCPVGHRGEFPDVRPSIRPSVLPYVPPLVGHFGLKSTLSDLILAFLSLKSALPGLNLALPTSNQLSRPQIRSPGHKSALRASNQLSRLQICPQGLNLAPKT